MIDSHHHFWNFSPEEYGWISESMQPLRQDFGPAELAPLMEATGISGVISVQARTNDEENKFLSKYAEQSDGILGVVGYLDLTRPDINEALDLFYTSTSKAVGIREVLQGLPDDDYCLRKDF
ncbi:MAG: amidohydrolase family protein, partial [Verrucomicrobiota bacterium]